MVEIKRLNKTVALSSSNISKMELLKVNASVYIKLHSEKFISRISVLQSLVRTCIERHSKMEILLNDPVKYIIISNCNSTAGADRSKLGKLNPAKPENSKQNLPKALLVTNRLGKISPEIMTATQEVSFLMF